jgi:hypothetical protein
VLRAARRGTRAGAPARAAWTVDGELLPLDRRSFEVAA